MLDEIGDGDGGEVLGAVVHMLRRRVLPHGRVVRCALHPIHPEDGVPRPLDKMVDLLEGVCLLHAHRLIHSGGVAVDDVAGDSKVPAVAEAGAEREQAAGIEEAKGV